MVALGTALLTAFTPHARVQRNIPYAMHDRGELDVYFPRRAAPRRPVALFIYGGSWQSGDKAMYAFVGRELAARGVVTVIADYRVYPEVAYPQFLRDNAEAVAFVKRMAPAWGADPRQLYLVGHSAGAYDAAMLGLDRRWLGAVGLDPRRDLAGVVGLAGPYDFLPLRDPVLKIIFGPKAGRADTQPINHVDGDAPPLFLAAGSADKVVDPGNTTRLAAAVRARGGKVEARLYPGVGHVGALVSIVGPFRGRAPVLDQMLAFMGVAAPEPAREAARAPAELGTAAS